MADENKKPYTVLNPIAHGGRVERGETIYLSDEEAVAFSVEDIQAAPVPATAGENVEGEVPFRGAENESADSPENIDDHADNN